MIIVTRKGISDAEVEQIRERVETLGLRTHLSRGEDRSVIGCVGDVARLREIPLLAMPGVEEVMSVARTYKLASRDFSPKDSVLRVGDGPGTTVGGRNLAVVAGPCSVEGLDMLRTTAGAVRAAGAGMLRGGAFKPRTSPYSFQGLGPAALEHLAEVRAETGMAVVTEVMDPRQVELVAEHADVLQIGARNMQNYPLLYEVGKVQRTVLLKRGLSATIKELLLAAEYVMSSGNRSVILCERGIRTYETSTRNTLDVAAVPVLQQETHLPVIVDPSHAAGVSRFVTPLAYAAIAAGADGIMVEVHPDPPAALSDGNQALTCDAFAELMKGLGAFAAAVGRLMPMASEEDRSVAAAS